ncbi:peroxisomal membrane protein PEX16 [Onthophagus taurus]|uniref:peroxisomal membrane protein PEX16 n=1 Tax=Onthophagus taurus TaxID=166361 RepID=UPI000C204915|nr:peroxisomal membrane protein PEX16 [Onthophagus taurus]
MSFIMFSFSELYRSYKNWIIKNPDKGSDFETTAKWISYFIAGRINNSHIVSELVYCLSNLLVFFNDRLIREGKNLLGPLENGNKLKEWMTVLEYSEVFLELSGQKLWGNKGRWFIVVCTQIIKCLSRFILIKKYKEKIIQSPPIPILDRMNLTPELTEEESVDVNKEVESASFTLKQSGKVIRKVDSNLSRIRDWNPVVSNSQVDSILEKDLAGRQFIAEMLYITKPIIHLCSSACFGYNTWKPWTLSLFMDITSLHLYYTCMQMKRGALTRKQRIQLSKRTLLLIMYILRSPFYEKHTQSPIENILKGLGNNIPLMGIISQPLLNYLPFWQSNYAYIWST